MTYKAILRGALADLDRHNNEVRVALDSGALKTADYWREVQETKTDLTARVVNATRLFLAESDALETLDNMRDA